MRYTEYLKRNFDTYVIVIFDGYGNNSTKSSKRNRRSLKYTSTEIIFEEEMNLTATQDNFLSNI